MTAGIGVADAAIYTGVCIDNADPLGNGRIKYCVPQLSGTEPFGWAYPISPGYTPIGASVYIAFEGGDRNRPIYWPEELPIAPATSFPTYAALIAANPIASTAVGNTYYVVDHGGSAQLQSTGLSSPSTEYQWLPSGFQGGQQQLHTSKGATGSNATLIANAGFNNPSTKRVFKVTASCSVTASTTTNRAVLSLARFTSAPASTLATSYGSFLNVARIPVGSGYLGLSVTYYESGVAAGLTYYGAYVSTDVNDSTTITSLDNQIIIEDIGAVT